MKNPSKLYTCWKNMRQRCNNKNNTSYKNYGARGIRVCERWDNFENFENDMGEPPSNKHCIDRIDNDGNYEPLNCRWATYEQQVLNQRIRKSNTTGVRGVSKIKNGYIAYFQYKGRQELAAGTFKTIEQASNAYEELKFCIINGLDHSHITNKTKTIKSNNKTGVRGVYMSGDKFAVSLTVKGEHKYLGTFETILEAEECVNLNLRKNVAN